MSRGEIDGPLTVTRKSSILDDEGDDDDEDAEKGVRENAAVSGDEDLD